MLIGTLHPRRTKSAPVASLPEPKVIMNPPGWRGTYSVISYTLPRITIQQSVGELCFLTSCHVRGPLNFLADAAEGCRNVGSGAPPMGRDDSSTRTAPSQTIFLSGCLIVCQKRKRRSELDKSQNPYAHLSINSTTTTTVLLLEEADWVWSFQNLETRIEQRCAYEPRSVTHSGGIFITVFHLQVLVAADCFVFLASHFGSVDGGPAILSRQKYMSKEEK